MRESRIAGTARTQTMLGQEALVDHHGRFEGSSHMPH